MNATSGRPCPVGIYASGSLSAHSREGQPSPRYQVVPSPSRNKVRTSAAVAQAYPTPIPKPPPTTFESAIVSGSSGVASNLAARFEDIYAGMCTTSAGRNRMNLGWRMVLKRWEKNVPVACTRDLGMVAGRLSGWRLV
jgi:hypothetical protein